MPRRENEHILLTGNIELDGFASYLEKEIKEPRRNINLFKTELSKLFQSKYLTLVNSGSSANLLAALLLKKQIENSQNKSPPRVLASSFSFPTTLSAFLLLGFEIELLEINSHTLAIDLNQLKAYDYSNSNICAILITHTLGYPAPLSDIRAICDQNDLYLIQDACETMNLEIEGSPLVEFGDMITYSFYHPHHLSAYGGGALAVNSQDLYVLAESISHWGRRCMCHLDPSENIACSAPQDAHHNFTYEQLGVNLEISELNATFGRFQLQHYSEHERIRMKRYKALSSILSSVLGVRIHQHIYSIQSNISPFACPVLFKEKIEMQKFQEYLSQNSVEFRTIMGGNMKNQAAFSSNSKVISAALSQSSAISSHSLILGIHQSIPTENFVKLLNIIKNYS